MPSKHIDCISCSCSSFSTAFVFESLERGDQTFGVLGTPSRDAQITLQLPSLRAKIAHEHALFAEKVHKSLGVRAHDCQHIEHASANNPMPAENSMDKAQTLPGDDCHDVPSQRTKLECVG